jgi:acyl dehydratase
MSWFASSGDLTDAKGAETVLSLTGRDEVKAHVGRELGVSDWQPVGRENLDASAQATGEEQLGHLDVGCCPRATA